MNQLDQFSLPKLQIVNEALNFPHASMDRQ